MQQVWYVSIGIASAVCAVAWWRYERHLQLSGLQAYLLSAVQSCGKAAGPLCNSAYQRKTSQAGLTEPGDRHASTCSANSDTEEDSDPEVEIPDEFKDPISLSVIDEPVMLCATGQVYCYNTLREWFKTGNRVCPRTNIEVLDVQVTRIPWLKHKIHEWRRQHGLDIPVEDTSMDRLREIHPSLPGWVLDIRSSSGQKRVKAASDLYEMMRKWETDHEVEATSREHRLIREVVMDDMVWLVRYGDPYLQGVAASILAYCDTPDEVQWLAPTTSIPAVMLCLSPNNYTSQAATRVLYNIARAGPVARRTIKVAGGAQSLLKVVATNRAEYGYSRDRAAAALAVLSKDAEVKAYLRRHALGPLKAMLLAPEGDRWEKRDAATALLAVQFTEEELGPELSIDRLFDFFWCSHAWLGGTAPEPNEGYGEEEIRARADLAFWRANAHERADQLVARDLVLVDAAAAFAAEEAPEEDAGQEGQAGAAGAGQHGGAAAGPGAADPIAGDPNAADPHAPGAGHGAGQNGHAARAEQDAAQVPGAAAADPNAADPDAADPHAPGAGHGAGRNGHADQDAAQVPVAAAAEAGHGGAEAGAHAAAANQDAAARPDAAAHGEQPAAAGAGNAGVEAGENGGVADHNAPDAGRDAPEFGA